MDGTTQEAGKTYLEHYGIKGMKWGVRRDRDSSGRVGGEGSDARGSKTDGRQTKLTRSGGEKVSNPKHMTEDELKAVVGRMNLEAQYDRLNPLPPKKVSLGKKLMEEAKEIGQSVARQQIKNTLNAVVAKQIQQATGLNTQQQKEKEPKQQKAKQNNQQTNKQDPIDVDYREKKK